MPDMPLQPSILDDERIAMYADWLDTNANMAEVAESIAAFRLAYPNSGLSWPDLGHAIICTGGERRSSIRKSLSIRSGEAQRVAIDAQQRQRLSERLSPIRKDVLRQSREAMRQTMDAMNAALVDTVIAVAAPGSSWQCHLRAVARYQRTIRELGQGGLRPSTIGSIGRWSGEGPDSVDLQYTVDSRRTKDVLDEHDLLINEGGVYTYVQAGPLRRDHAGKVVTSDPVLIGRALRYRGGNRPNESKGIFNEEGWRRTIGQVVTGRRDGLTTRSRRQLHAALVPWVQRTMHLRLKAVILERWGHLPGRPDILADHAMVLLANNAPAVLQLPNDLVGNNDIPKPAYTSVIEANQAWATMVAHASASKQPAMTPIAHAS